MSIRYRFFGVPVTKTDFMSEARLRDQELGVVFYKRVYESGRSHLDFYNTCFEIRLGGRNFKLEEVSHIIIPLRSQEEHMAIIASYDQEDLDRAGRIAEDLNLRGVKTVIKAGRN